MRVSTAALVRAVLATSAAIGLAGCSQSVMEPTPARLSVKVSEPVMVGSGISPFEDMCGQLSDGFTFIKDEETDPRLAVNPNNPDEMTVAFMRDPILAVSAAYTQDGGKTWQESEPPEHSPCTGTDYNAYGDQDIDTDASGRLYLAHTQGNFLPEGQPMDATMDAWMDSKVVAAVSEDGGKTWSKPLELSPMGEYQHMVLVAADKQREGHAVVLWAVGENPSVLEHMSPHLEDKYVYIAKTSDGGKSWSKPEKVMEGFGALDLVQFSDGQLLAVGPNTQEKMDWFLNAGLVGAIDNKQGDWSQPFELPLISNTGVFNHPEGDTVMAIDVPVTVGSDDRLYQIASRFERSTICSMLDLTLATSVGWCGSPQKEQGQLLFSASADRGVSWSEAAAITAVKGPIWNASIAVTDKGTLGAFWYDSRDDIPDDGQITSRAMFAVSTDGGNSWKEVPLSESFDMKQAPTPHQPLYMGNYVEVKALSSNSFGVAYPVAAPLNKHGRSDMHFNRITVEQ
ncbi:exo-alpha-sialidase [Pseudomaricurvus alkylphenolicus]|uniref:sialidase family protein n=1 Tax=Pseudomaricurvus alkylphenolicus TaxID=1306991 RepID=UPI001421C1A1|nr:sialidase family protein [Pseudomaricurvus alkylphenolicus]NIB45064.1 exo-alpha-sialidase [Pseudomaricurvus alkylphenolicus]